MSNPKRSVPGLTWEAILAEEPFEGEHWEGIYPRSTDDQFDARSGSSTPSLSPWDDSDLDESVSSPSLPDIAEDAVPPEHASSVDKAHLPPAAYRHRQDVEDLQARQYWRSEWRTDISTTRAFNIGDASTLGSCIYYVCTELNPTRTHRPHNVSYSRGSTH